MISENVQHAYMIQNTRRYGERPVRMFILYVYPYNEELTVDVYAFAASGWLWLEATEVSEEFADKIWEDAEIYDVLVVK